MEAMVFEWDKRKALSNQGKHGVEFAETVFADPLDHDSDPDHALAEERFVIIGASQRRRLLVVVHTNRGESIRLISARLASKHERRHYEETCQ
jgi:uncharacterized DUF497 family protein